MKNEKSFSPEYLALRKQRTERNKAIKEHLKGSVLEGTGVTGGINRAKRRNELRPKRFMSNSNGIPMAVYSTFAYYKRIQEILCKDGTIKRIEHYVPKRSI